MALAVPAPDTIGRWGHRLLGAAFAAALTGILYLGWAAPRLAPFVPLVLLAAPVGLYALKQFPRSLYVVLLGYALIASEESGFQVQEIAYGLLYLGFLAYWYVSRTFFYRDEGPETGVDWAFVVFLAYAAVSVGWGVFFTFDPYRYVGETLTLTMLAFYFPVREACRRHPDAPRKLLGVVLLLALFVSVRNLLNFREVLTQATFAWEVTDGRVALNEVVLMMGSLAAFTLLIFARTWPHRLLLLGAFLIYFASLLVTQSRAYWASFLFGAFVLFLAVEVGRRGIILLLVAGGLAGALLVGLLLFPEFLRLLAAGIIDRFASLGTATSSDISLLNRFQETEAVWERIKQNPILGYGMGVRYQYFNIIYKHTRDWSFIHNGYAALWYKFGLVGLGSILFIWARSAWDGFRLFKDRHLPQEARLAGLIALICLVGETLVANTSNPFIIGDATLLFALLTGMVSGLASRRRHAPAASPTAAVVPDAPAI